MSDDPRWLETMTLMEASNAAMERGDGIKCTRLSIAMLRNSRDLRISSALRGRDQPVVSTPQSGDAEHRPHRRSARRRDGRGTAIDR
jgi:hypothetical protein